MLQMKRQFNVLKAGIFSAAFFGFMLSASTVFADIVAPTTNTPFMNSASQIGVDGSRGNPVEYVSGLKECRGGTGDNGGSFEYYLTLYGYNKATSGFGTGTYAFSKGGRGGDGGSNTSPSCPGYSSKDGGDGGGGNVVNAYLSVNGNSTSIPNTTLSSTGIYAISAGGNGGNGGYNNQGGDSGKGGKGGGGHDVYVQNQVGIVTGNTAGSYGIFAQSYGGNGGQGGDSRNCCFAGDGGGGGSGGHGGSVTVKNQGDSVFHATIDSALSIPIFAQSLGGTGGGGGDSTGGTFSGGGGGSGGNGASAGSIFVTNGAALSSGMVGGFAIHAQSVGGSGGTAGASAGLVALGATGGEAATGGTITLTNAGAITLTGTSSIGLHAQSVGGGGGHGGLATGTVAIGGSGGLGGDGAAVYAQNSGIINTGYNVSNTASTNGGAFGIVAQSVGGGGGVGGMGISNAYSVASFSLAVGGIGGSGGSGRQVVVANSNSINTIEPNSAAVLAQSIGGGGGSGGGAVSISGGAFFGFGSGVGGLGGTGGNGGLVGVNCASSSRSSSNPCYNLPTVDYDKSATSNYVYFTETQPISGAQISTSGVGSPGILAQSVGGGGGNGGYAIQLAAAAPGTGLASLSSAFGGKAGSGGYGSSVYASAGGVKIYTTGSDSPGLLANSIGGGGGTGGVSVSGSYSDTYSAALSIGGSGGSGGNGSSVTAENTYKASSITTTGARSYGILAQSIGGGGGSGGASIALSGGGVASLALALGGTGTGGGDGNVVSLSNEGNITTSGSAASALIAQSIGGGGGNGGFSVSGSAGLAFSGAVSVGGGGGRGGTGMDVTLYNSGSLLTQGGGGAAILAQSIGGGGGNGGFSGAGSLSFSSPVSLSVGGSGAAGGTSKPVTVTNYGNITANNTSAFVNASNSSVVAAGHNPGILAQSIGGSGGFGGFSVGAAVGAVQALGFSIAGSGGVGGGSGDVTVTNRGDSGNSAAVGAITTAGPLSSAIIAQSFGGNGGNGGLAAGGAVSSILSLSSSLGGAGGSGGRSGVINISNSGALAVNGVMSSAILAQSIGGSGGNGGVAVAGSLTVNLTTIPVTAAVATSVGGSAGTGAISNVVSVTNSAGITASGNQSGGIVAQSIGGSGGTGGNAVAGAVAYADFDSSKSMSASVTLSGRGGSTGYANTTTVNLNNPSSGNYTISTNGLLANAVLAQSIGGGGGNAGSSFSGSSAGGISASVNIASDGGAGGRAGAVVVNTASQVILSTLLDQSSGIVAQSIGGSGGNGGLAAGAAISNSKSATVSIGGSGSSGGSANTVNVANSAIINTKGLLSLGIIAQSIGGSGGNGGSSYGGALAQDAAVAVTLGGGSGSGGTANKVTVNNYNAITTAKSQSTGILAQSIGGVGGNGGISASGGLSVSNTLSLAIGGAGGNGGQGGAVEINSLNGGVINVAGNQSLGLVGQSIGGSGGNGGSVIDAGAALNFITGRAVTVSVGDSGGAGGTASGVSVQSYQNITTNGLNGIGILGQSIGGAGGNGVNSMSFGFDNVPGTGIDSTFLTVGGSGAHDGTSQSVAINQTGVISTANPNRSTAGITNDQAAGIVAQSIGGNGGNGGNARTNVAGSQGSVSLSIGGQGAYGANSNGVVSVYSNQNQTTGSITTDGMIAPTILAQSIGGGGGNGGWTQSNTTSNQYGVGFSLGGWGGNGGNANQANVYSGGALTTTGQQSSAIIAQSIGGGGGNGGVATTQVSTSPGSAANGLTSVVGAQIAGLTNVGSQAATYLATNLVQTNASSSGNPNTTPKPTTSNTAPNSGVSASLAVGGFGGNAGLGNAVTVASSSIINTSGAQANGITAQSIGGGGGIGGSSTSGADGGKYSAALSVGGFGGSSARSSTVAATNSGSIMTTGDLAMGIFAQSVGGGGGSASSSSASSTTNAGGAAAVSLILGSWRDVSGSSGTGSAASMQAIGVTNSGTILTQGINSSGIFAQSVGGGGGHGGSSSTSSNVAANSGSSGSSSAGTGGSSTPATSNTANSSVAGNTASGQYSSQAGSDKGTAFGLTVGGYGGSGGFANNVSVTNSGTIQTGYASTATLSSQRLALGLSDNSVAIFVQSVGGGGGSGGSATSNADGSKASVSLALGANAGTSGDAGTVTVNNTGSLQTYGNNSSSIFAQSVGGGGGNGVSSTSTSGTGGSNAVAFGLGGSGGNAGFGSAVTVNSSVASTLIKTYGALSHGIFAQSVGGGGGNTGAVNNAATATTGSISDNGTTNTSTAGAGTTSSLAKSGVSIAAGLGGSGGSGGNAGVVAVTNASQITTAGIGSYGIIAQSVGGGGGNAGSSTTQSNGNAYNAAFTLGMSGSASGSGDQVTISSSNSVSTAGDNALGIFAQSVGGGGGNAGSSNSTSSTHNGYGSVKTALGSSGSGSGSGAGGNGSSVTISETGSSNVLQTSGKNAIAILAQSVGGGGGSTSNVISGHSLQSNSATFALGGNTNSNSSSESSGDGGSVNLTNAAKVLTSGDNAVGVFGQSVGGGGGISALAQNFTTATNLTAKFNLGGGIYGSTYGYYVSGDGGAVNITNTNSVSTSGTNSIGVFGQSIGGGGGYVVSTSSGGSINLSGSSLGGSNMASGNGGAVSVTQSGSVTASGIGVVGIVAQSVGGGGGYVSIVSKDTSSSINSSNQLTIGAKPFQGSSNNGNGGAVTVTTNASVSATGANAIGILAQSVGGGGGAFVTSGQGTITPTYSAGKGYGGAVTVNANSPISVSGNYARGILAESVGGGGGFAISGSSLTHGGGRGTGDGGVVIVNLAPGSYVSVSGRGAIGIYTSTVNGTADPFITIGSGSFVSASDGATAIAINGANNQLVNHGSILVGDALADKAVEILSQGVNDFQNHGTIVGRINNAAAANVSFINHEGARFESVGGLAFMGGNTFTNKGLFIPRSDSENAGSVHNFVGTFNQTSTGILGINLDHDAGLADLLMLGESGTFNLAGKAQANFLNAHLIKPGTTSQIEVIRANGRGSSLTLDDAFTIDRTAIMDISLVKSPTSIKLVSSANFAPAGLSTFATQVGSAIGAYQTDGSNAFFQAAVAQLVNVPTVSDLELAYTKLTGAVSAIKAMPQANYQAVARAVGTVSDHMNSWRVGDSFIATTKTPVAMLTGVGSTITPVAAPIASGTVAAAAATEDGEHLSSMQVNPNEASAWITPFAGDSNSNNLAYQVYGQSIGIEKESDDRKFISGAALTVSQSNTTYSSSTNPSTPGSVTNYGASIYFGARHESAYLTAIGYLGGSRGRFSRQLQILDFNTSTSAKVNSNILSARVEAGYNLLPNPEGKRALQVTPFVAIAPTQIRQHGAFENSDDLGAGLYYGSNRNTAVPVSLGTEISGDMQLGNNEALRSFLRVSWVHDLKNPGSMSAAYNPSYGPTLYTNGTPSMGNMVVIRGGTKYNLGNNISAYATVDLEQGSGANNFRGIGGSLGAMYSW